MRCCRDSLAVAILVVTGLTVAGPAQAEPPKFSSDGMELVLNRSPLLEQGRRALMSGKLNKAIAYLERALEKGVSRRQTAGVHNDLCVAFQLSKRYEEAIAQCDKAIGIRPNSWRFYNNRGSAYLEMGDIERAKADFSVGLDLAPKADVLQHNMKLALQRSGEGATLDPLADRLG